MIEQQDDELTWFFGYGSLMWNPGFAWDAFETAELVGWHREFCIVSRHYRGTTEHPGLVLGLAPGGACVGRAIGVTSEREDEVLDYLDAREQAGGVYVYDRLRLPVSLKRREQAVEAWCYVSRPDHEDFVGSLDQTAIARVIKSAHGVAGSNADYARRTTAHLTELGISDERLQQIVAALDATS